jgi:hypothetical protein
MTLSERRTRLHSPLTLIGRNPDPKNDEMSAGVSNLHGSGAADWAHAEMHIKTARNAIFMKTSFGQDIPADGNPRAINAQSPIQ